MSDRLHEVAQHIADHGLDADSWFTLRETVAESWKDTDSPRIIRTFPELEALDPETVLIPPNGHACTPRVLLLSNRISGLLPATVIATGAQVRAAQEAMELDND